ncbi:hypothetical protein D9613_012362 [Agrocybe pediades]|uniref:BTB domain-containing protein n=1 Tax=Agrocybe pediades TaxID=84607 RepID=A0A8H4VN59_9AGAR|nr:hypothetical protein D9613_012362 [Agrocybe pediades]
MSVSGQIASAITNSTSFWFDDGNLVLEVEDMRFRVYRSILSHHSSFFKDLSLFPQPVDSKEVTEDGTPILKIPFDSKEEWETSFIILSSELQKLQTLMDILHLSHKYHFKRFEELARDGIQQFIPLEYEAWMASDYRRQTGRVYDELQGNELKFLRVVKEVGGMEEYYPTLYFMCIWGVTDATVFLKQLNCTKDGVQLDTSELMTLIGGRERFLEASSGRWTRALSAHVRGEKCPFKKGCATKVKEAFLKEMLDIFSQLDPKNSALGKSLTTITDYNSLCDGCRDHLSLIQSEASTTLWKDLHVFFAS